MVNNSWRRSINPTSILSLLASFYFAVAATAEPLKRQSEIPIERQRLIPATKKVEMTGEVVDAWCYASQVMGPGRGQRHKACALACIHGGVSAGILDEKTGELFIAAKHKGYTGCKDLLLPFVAKRVTVKGWTARKGGCNLIKIQEVKLAEAEAKTAVAGAKSSQEKGFLGPAKSQEVQPAKPGVNSK